MYHVHLCFREINYAESVSSHQWPDSGLYVRSSILIMYQNYAHILLLNLHSFLFCETPISILTLSSSLAVQNGR